MNIIILTEAGSKIGFGHLTRCISIYEAFCQKGFLPEFIIQGDDSIDSLMCDKKHRFIDWIDNPAALQKIVSEFHVVIIDSISVSEKTCLDIGERVSLPVYIDDYNDYKYRRGLLIDWEVLACSRHRATAVEMLIGPKYAALRREFWDVSEKHIADVIETVLITMGGTDVRGITPLILRLLTSRYPELKKRVIIGNGFVNIDKILDEADLNTFFVNFPDAAQMRDAMAEADLAISASGQTLYELARIGLPTIAITVAENQLHDLNGWLSSGFIQYAGWWENSTLTEAINQSIVCLKGKDERVRRKHLGKNILDGMGVHRIVEKILLEHEKMSAKQGL